MHPVKQPRDIAIVGAGLTGVACAIAISRELGPSVSGLSIQVYERNDFPCTSGVMEELEKMGTYSGADIGSVEIFPEKSTCPIGSVDFTGRTGNGYSGYKGRRVMRVVLLTAMISVAERANVKFAYGKKVIGGDEVEEKAIIHFEDGSLSSADLVLGCDGVHSATRMKWVDPHRSSEYSGFSSLQAVVDINKISSPLPFDSAIHLSRQGFLLTTHCDRDREHIFAAATVQFEEEEIEYCRLKQGVDLSTRNRIQSNLRRCLETRFRKCVAPCVNEIVHGDHDWILYPVHQVRPGGRWCLNRVALLGDAAHAMPPMYSSASYALDDAVLFSRLLARYGSDSLNTVFGTYDQLRRAAVNRAFEESTIVWNQMKDRGPLQERVKEWRMSSYLRHNQVKYEDRWRADATKTPIPTPEASEPLVSLQSFLREFSEQRSK
ncbi:hypothetical protein N7524_006633 [Penicillium chrysogenum]|nr:hypothetical protein N7524_006633 [Penicillium chrysogenum]